MTESISFHSIISQIVTSAQCGYPLSAGDTMHVDRLVTLLLMPITVSCCKCGHGGGAVPELQLTEMVKSNDLQEP